MNAMQETIKSYIGLNKQPSQHTIQCFVGMIETGEASYHDFRVVGGDSLVDAVDGMRNIVS